MLKADAERAFLNRIEDFNIRDAVKN